MHYVHFKVTILEYICEKKKIHVLNAGVLLNLIPGRAGHKLAQHFVVADTGFCSPLKVSKGCVRNQTEGAVSLTLSLLRHSLSVKQLFLSVSKGIGPITETLFPKQ